MRTKISGILCLFALLPLCAGAGTKVSDREELVTGEIPKPGQIWVYDFSATASDVPAESALAGQVVDNSATQTDKQVATGREVGADIAAELVRQIQAMGMPAARPTADTKPAINDLVFRGHLVSMREGEKKERILVGFGAGESELKAAVEGFQMTDHGLRALGKGTTDSTAGKTPGVGVGALTTIATHNPLGLIVSTGIKVHEEKTGSDTLQGRAKATAKEIADVLKQRFRDQGWIK